MSTEPNLTLYFDGGARSNPGPAAAGVVLHTDSGESLLEAGYLLGEMTNNQAEYSALLIGSRAAVQYGAQQLEMYSDSELLVRQLNGEYRVKSALLKPLYEDVQEQLRGLKAWSIKHIPRGQNRRADALVNLALDADEDVVEVQAVDGPAPLTPNKTSRSATPTCDREVRVVVEAVAEGSSPPCPTSCLPGTRFVVDDILPVGLNLDLASKVLEAVRTFRGPGGSAGQTEMLAVACVRCGARFRISADHRGADSK